MEIEINNWVVIARYNVKTRYGKKTIEVANVTSLPILEIKARCQTEFVPHYNFKSLIQYWWENRHQVK